MNTQTKGSTITFTDVLWKLLASWKLVIILAVAGFVAASLYVKKSYDAKEAEYLPQKAEYDRVMEEYETRRDFVLKFNAAGPEEKTALMKEAAPTWEAKLSEEQLLAMENTDSVKKLLDDNSEYMRKSILMNLDPYNVNTLYMVYELYSETVGLNNLLNDYCYYLTSDECLKKLGEKMGWNFEERSTALYAELFSAWQQNGNQVVINAQFAPEDDLEVLASAIQAEFETYKATLDATIGSHYMTLVTKTIGVKANNGLAGTQNALQNQQLSYNNQYASLKNSMKAVPEQYYLYVYRSGDDYENVELDVPREPDIKEPGKLRSKNTYRIIGLAIGLILAFGYVYLSMLFSRRLERTEELHEIYGLPIVGSIYRKHLIPVDSLIVRLRKGKNGAKDNDAALKLMSDSIKVMCDKQEVKNIAVLGSSIGKNDADTVKKLSESLKKKGVSTVVTGNILCDGAVREAVSKADAFVLAETVGKAKYKLIDEETQLLYGMGIKQLCSFGIE
ncbi:MAG: hypothetical protein K6G24_06680 [Lachnospiraceae bacterium]|nr:hypothetical protein [Lachnospiraceae bacterium]